MDALKLKENKNIKDTLFQISDYISELEILIININVLSEEIYTSLSELPETDAEAGQLIVRRNLDILGIKSGMIREFIIRADEKIDNLASLSDVSINLININNL